MCRGPAALTGGRVAPVLAVSERPGEDCAADRRQAHRPFTAMVSKHWAAVSTASAFATVLLWE